MRTLLALELASPTTSMSAPPTTSAALILSACGATVTHPDNVAGCPTFRDCGWPATCEGLGRCIHHVDMEPVDAATADDVVGGVRRTLTLYEQSNGEIGAELCAWIESESGVPVSAQWGPLAALAPAVRRAGVDVKTLLRAAERACLGMGAMSQIAGAMAVH